MILRVAVLSAVLLAGPVVADDEASRAKLMGGWQQAEGGKDAAIWAFSEKVGALHIINSAGSRPIAEFDCDTFGHECDIKDGGRAAKVSLWYAGPKLVEMETRGSSVLKRTFGVTGEGDTMDLEFMQIAPTSKTEILHFKRMAAANGAR